MADAALQLQVREDGIAVLTINQPGSRANVLNHALWNELKSTLTAIQTRTDLRGLIVASAKPGIFIAGADLKFFQNIPASNDPSVREFVELGLSTLEILESLPFPTCAAIDGAALGGGLEVALACDLRVCGSHPRCELGLPEVKLGLIPGWGGTQRLPRIVGYEPAAEMIASGKSLSAQQACDAQLASAVVQSDALVEFAAKFVTHPGWQELRDSKRGPVPYHQEFMPMVVSDPASVREAMVLLQRTVALTLAEGLPLESDVFCRLVGSPTSRRMIDEFFASRKKS